MVSAIELDLQRAVSCFEDKVESRYAMNSSDYHHPSEELSPKRRCKHVR